MTWTKLRLGALLLSLMLVSAGCGFTKGEYRLPTLAPLQIVPGPGLSFGDTKPHIVQTIVYQDQGIVGWLGTDNTLSVAGINLATNKPTWPKRDLGKFDDWGGMGIVGDALIVNGERNGIENPGEEPTDADRALFVLDPANGELRWKANFDVNDGALEFFEAAVVVRSAAEPVTKGLDWKTGEVLWTIPDEHGPVTEVFGIKNSKDSAPSGAQAGYTDHRLIQLSEDKTMRIYDARTGALLETRNDVKNGSLNFAQDNMIYSFSEGEKLQVYAYDLTQSDSKRLLYEKKNKNFQFIDATSCGSGRLCFIESYGEEVNQVAVEIATGQQLWSVRLDPFASMGGIETVNNNILIGHTLYSPTGKVVVEPRHKQSLVQTQLGKINNNTLIEFNSRTKVSHNSTAEIPFMNEVMTNVYIISIKDRKHTLVGSASMASLATSWSDQYLIFVQKGKIVVARI